MLYQKTTQNAIAAVSRLAELYCDPNQRASSRDIAESRNLPAPIVAKILTELSRGGLIEGSPGPGGGYRLARPPAEISLQDVADLFERDSNTACPYGPGWCGVGEPCPLHQSMETMRKRINEYLVGTNFAVFEPQKNKLAKRIRGRAATRRR
jgi:Rrf2 family transcriptional regulator, iron-sulfur cluster assembly transcription factor